MPDTIRYYFWNEGSEVQGPYTTDELRQLYRDRVIGVKTQLCPEGGTAWQPFDLNLVRSPLPGGVRPPPPPVLPPAPQAQAESSSSGSSRRWSGTNWWDRDTRGSHIGRTTFAVLGWLAMIAVSFSAAKIHQPLSPLVGSPASYFIGYWMGTIVCFWFVAFVVTIALPRWLRIWFRSSLYILISLFYLVGPMLSGAERVIAAQAIRSINQKGQELAAASVEMDKNSPSVDPADLKTIEDVTKGETAILKLRSSFAAVNDYLSNYDHACREALAQAKISENHVGEYVAAAHKANNVEDLMALWQVKVKLCDDQVARLAFLEKNWGHWSVKDGKVLFEDQATADAYNVFITAGQKDLAAINDLKNKIDAAARQQPGTGT